MSNEANKTTKMARADINQDHLASNDQQRSEGSALDMMKGMHEHEEHDSEDNDQR